MQGDPFLPDQTISNLITLDLWRGQLGKTAATIWRWRKKGWLRGVVNISGRLYIDRDAIADFERRAASGEFAAEHKTPRRISSQREAKE